jgi:2-amino-4-hydroxy-6-hydroxymethyldihydropteridine diphosphokinase
MQDRAFVLMPLADVTPAWVHPRTGQSIRALIAALPPQEICPI